MKADLVIKTSGQLVTCASGGEVKKGRAMRELGVVSGGAVAVLNGQIAGVGTESDVFGSFRCDNVVDAGTRVVMPGFVDPHTHIVFAGDRLDEFEMRIAGADYLEILAKGGGILSTVDATRNASQHSLVNSALERLDKMLACATTTVEIKTGYGLTTESELKMLRVIEEVGLRHPVQVVPTLLAAHAVPAEYRSDPAEYVDLICTDILPAAWNWYQGSHFFAQRVPFFVDVFCERNAFDVKQMLQIFDTAAGLGYLLKAHVDEFTNLGGSRIAIKEGAASIDHLDAISDKEIKLLADSRTLGVVTPTVNFNLGSSHFADARKLIDSGCALALSTDYNPGSAPCPSQGMTMAIAYRYQKLVPSEAINAATCNAAFAAGVGNLTGSLEAGKQADVSIFEADDCRELCYEFGAVPIHSVYKDGTLVYGHSC